MSPIDAFIIYLTFGAPFGVFYFFHRGERLGNFRGSLLVTLFWIPYAIRLLFRHLKRRLPKSKIDERCLLDSIERKFTHILFNGKTCVALFEFRETFERYVGLSKAASVESVEDVAEIFEISAHENKELATKLLNRRNRSRLNAHLTHARRDFLRTIEKIYPEVSDKEKLRRLALGFVTLLNDEAARAGLQKLFQESAQFNHEDVVNGLESVVWNPIENKRLAAPGKTLNSRAISPSVTTTLNHD